MTDSSRQPPPPRPEHLLGHLAVERGLISSDQLARATALQSREGGEPRLGDILVDLGWLSEDDVRALTREQAKRQADASAATARRAEPELAAGASMAEIMLAAVEAGASDIHLHAGSPPIFRIDGALAQMSDTPLTPEETESAVVELLSSERRAKLVEDGQIDCALTVPGLARFRCNAYRQQRGTDAVLRLVPLEPPTLASLGLPSTLARFANFDQGLVLITGPAGCGKSSTLAALLNLINEERRHHVISAEDPIEFLHPPKRGIVNQREIGEHSRDFAKVLRAALREDPDVIAIGELRDHETVSLALTAAETGHLVLATLHTDSAVRTVDRVIGVYPPDEQEQVRVMLSESLRAVVSQRLARRNDGAGRVAALEVLVVTRAVSTLIRDDKTFQIPDAMQTGTAEGMRLMQHALDELVRAGTISREEAARHASTSTSSQAQP